MASHVNAGLFRWRAYCNEDKNGQSACGDMKRGGDTTRIFLFFGLRLMHSLFKQSDKRQIRRVAEANGVGFSVCCV
jgi:hypothetical protein